MAQESPKNSAAEIPVTSNGEVDDAHEHSYNRDLKHSLPSGLGLSETQITSHGFDSTKEGVIEAGASQETYQKRASDPNTDGCEPPCGCWELNSRPLEEQSGGQRTHAKGGPVILADEIKNPAMEKLELVRKWSLNTYKCTRQIISEKLGRGSRTVDLELEAQIDILRDNKKKYENILKLAQTLSTQLFQMVHTQKQLGDAFADLSLKSLELHKVSLCSPGCPGTCFVDQAVFELVETPLCLPLITSLCLLSARSKGVRHHCRAYTIQSLRWLSVEWSSSAGVDASWRFWEKVLEFGYNADTQKLLAKNGETLLGAINFFIASVNTLVNKTIEDTLMTVKQYESARIEYDAYRTDLEELNLGPRDANTLPKIEHSQHLFQIHKEKYDKMRSDVSVKLKFLEENKVKVLRNQLVLFHSAVAAYFAGNQKQLELTLKQFHVKLKAPGVDAPSWLEEQ
ncbi:Arfaptin-1 [Apodemus speciosus]|uniref:Arfaptin-1 n=1 Tax=Apodemus speciosus TaxID=105296 RepID=A0ABQ0EL72_APOSI